MRMRPLRDFLFLPGCGARAHAGACCKGVAVGRDRDRCNAIRGVRRNGDIGAAVHYTSVRRRVDRDAGRRGSRRCRRRDGRACRLGRGVAGRIVGSDGVAVSGAARKSCVLIRCSGGGARLRAIAEDLVACDT